MIKYEIPNQVTGIAEEAGTWEEAKILKAKIISEYMAYIGNIFAVSIKIQNEDGSWTQSVADSEGNPIIHSSFNIE